MFVHRYIRYFTLLTPNAYNVCDVEFQSRGLTSNYPSKIRELRPDTFGQLLSLSNVQPGSRTLCVEDASGCIIGGLLARMAGQGQLLQLHDADSPPSLPVLPNYNLIQKEMKPYQWIHWAMAEKDYEPPVQDDDITAGTASAAAAVGAPDTKRVEKDRKKQKRRLEQRKDVNRRRALLHEGHWDACVWSSSGVSLAPVPRCSFVLFDTMTQTGHEHSVRSELHGRLPQALPGRVRQSRGSLANAAGAISLFVLSFWKDQWNWSLDSKEMLTGLFPRSSR